MPERSHLQLFCLQDDGARRGPGEEQPPTPALRAKRRVGKGRRQGTGDSLVGSRGL